MPGDVNSDAKVDMADLAIMLQNQGQAGGRSRGDLNWDGLVDVRDYQILSQNLGKTGVAPLLGDTDGDLKVDFNDFKTLMANSGKYGGFGQGDFNGDGAIDVRDYQLLMQNFGKTATAFQPFGATALPGDVPPDPFGAVTEAVTPEPTGALLTLGALALTATRRRRR
jgi:MYXO-CTERM domain-containing protein